MSHYITLDRQVERLREKANRWTYRGQPIRKARRLQILETRMETYGRTHLAGLL
jgi:hypothetical protein